MSQPVQNRCKIRQFGPPAASAGLLIMITGMPRARAASSLARAPFPPAFLDTITSMLMLLQQAPYRPSQVKRSARRFRPHRNSGSGSVLHRVINQAQQVVMLRQRWRSRSRFMLDQWPETPAAGARGHRKVHRTDPNRATCGPSVSPLPAPCQAGRVEPGALRNASLSDKPAIGVPAHLRGKRMCRINNMGDLVITLR